MKDFCATNKADWSVLDTTRARFIAKVKEQGAAHARDFAWRQTQDPYAILVSEVMLQQTQVSRVDGRFAHWLQLFPTVDALSSASNAEVLSEWQGMGYNRRALNLKRACEICSTNYGGALPQSYEELLALPGVGPSTAAGVMSFAYNAPSLYLETNVRSVFIHELFPDEMKVSDKQLQPYVWDTCDKSNPRGWYYLLLDYGAYLKSKLGLRGNPGARSAQYSKQSSFEGSLRQKRAELLRYVLEQPKCTFDYLYEKICVFEINHGRSFPDSQLVFDILTDLEKEGFLSQSSGKYSA